MNPDENLDPNGEIAETPTDSQSETITAGQDDTVNQNGAGTQTPEEANWNNLTGSSQERFRQMARNANLWRQKAEEAETSRITTSSSSVSNPTLSANDQEAVRKLNEQYGIATKTDVERTVDEEVTKRIGGLVYNLELDKLEAKYNGSNGLPAFTRDEYENYVATHQQFRNYRPEDVYEKMFPTEILDYKVKSLGKDNTTKQSPSLRPTRTQVREEQWTPEAIETRLQQADGPEWYDKNVNLVNTVLGRSAE